ncbi:MlaD family protein [Gordonia sp. ABSL49_1]|uniref:MlaD family protein n=1 Tax=Gordonia sp. ABSL49_1 TaxID=2920941 RepID=UPI001F101C1F|nr:MlaD family protein [Gordonia sp. ABSL49_1]MCH5644966.1 MlaD family protein [Gordonia sp. ABSL49_1]
MANKFGMPEIRGRQRALVAAIVAVAVVVGAVTIYSRLTADDTRPVCAQLPDAAGLYVGNAVNVRGVRVGKVTAISAHDNTITVDMRIDRSISAKTSLVAVNNSVLADRRIELVDSEARGGQTLATDQCIPLNRSHTPISVSTAFQSFTTMFNEVGGKGTDSGAPVGALLTAADRQLDGTGKDINATVTNLSRLMADPDRFLGQMRTVFDNLAVLTNVANQNWDGIREIGINAATLTHFMARLFEDFVYIFDGLGRSGPGLDDLLGNVLPPVLDMGDVATPFIDVAIAHTDDLKTILEKTPGIATSLATTVNRNAAAFHLSYRGPRVAVRTPNSATLCALVNRADPGGCNPRTASVSDVDLAELVARAVQGGAR